MSNYRKLLPIPRALSFFEINLQHFLYFGSLDFSLMIQFSLKTSLRKRKSISFLLMPFSIFYKRSKVPSDEFLSWSTLELPNQKLYTEVFHTCDQRPAQRILKLLINPQALVAQKTADEVVFRRFQGEGVEFFKIGPH